MGERAPSQPFCELITERNNPGAGASDPFNWIKVHPLMPKEMAAYYPFDHAGRGETSLLMALCPEAVEMERWSPELWYTADAGTASAQFGATGREMILSHLRRCITP